jgi:glucose-6-phosphate 1-dehydrogenase
VETAWGLIDPIIEAWQANDQNIATYLKGTWGPVEADALLAKDGCSWSTWDGQIG